MSLNTIKFSQFSQGSLANTTNSFVGVTSPSGGTNFQIVFPLVWSTATRPSSPALGTNGYNSSLGQMEVWNGAAWVQLAAGGSGSVNTGGAGELGYYAGSGTAISGLMSANNSVLITDGSGIPSWSTTLPSILTIPQPNIVGVTDGSSAAAGNVGEVIKSVIPSGSAVTISNTQILDLTSISVTAGQWLVFGNISFVAGTTMNSGVCWLSTSSATPPDRSLYNQLTSASTSYSGFGCNVPTQIFDFNSTTTIYISGTVNSSSDCTMTGGIYALRVR